MTYRILPPAPGGRRERRLRARARRRTMWQVGAVGAVAAMGAVSFSAAGIADGARTPDDEWAAADETVAPVQAPEVVVEVSTVTEAVEIAHGSVETSDPRARAGTSRVVQAGEPGTELVSYTVTTVNGVEVDRLQGIAVMVEQPQDEIVAVGSLVIPPATDVQKGSNRELGKQMAEERYGWTGDEWSCLDNLWRRESNWSHTAENRSSGAYGIPQALPGDKMATYGADWRTNPATQIKWGLAYIKGRYSTPCGAWGHFNDKNWY